MTGTWATDWATNDVVTAAEFRKSMGCVFDSTLGVSAATIDITPIPTTYAHLLVDMYLRGDTAATSTVVLVRLNGDSGANYDVQTVNGSAAAVTAAEAFAQTSMNLFSCPANTAPANVFGGSTLTLHNYGQATNNKELTSEANLKLSTASGGLTRAAACGFWRSNAAVNRITILPTAGNFVAGSRVSVYVLGS